MSSIKHLKLLKESSAEQVKGIGDSQELLWISGTYMLRINYFTYLHLLYVGDIRIETYVYLGHANTFADLQKYRHRCRLQIL